MSNLGASFKKAREASGLQLDKIALDTRISTRFLLAIESEEFHLLPGGIFNRGFIRSYAERLGMDPERALTDYDSLFATKEEPLEVLRNAERASTRRTERNFYPIAAAILVLLIGGYYVANRQYNTPRETPPQAVLTPAPTSTPEVPPVPVETTQARTVPAVASAPPPVPIPVEEAYAGKPPAYAVTPAPEVVVPQVAAATITAIPAATIPVPAPATATARTVTTGTPGRSTLVLDVDIKDVTWVRISADGTVLIAETLQPGATRHISAERSIEITVGNAAGASLKINGRDLGVLGQSGRVRELKITPDNADRIGG